MCPRIHLLSYNYLEILTKEECLSDYIMAFIYYTCTQGYAQGSLLTHGFSCVSRQYRMCVNMNPCESLDVLHICEIVIKSEKETLTMHVEVAG